MTDGLGSTKSACAYVGALPRIKSSARLTRCTEERASRLVRVPGNTNEYNPVGTRVFAYIPV